ncbi:MAG TPA: glycine--tRNA ligase subunit beta [Firmicutes bacterium]|nr:glycine--tRNA ligase subunit beta [Candidatus Fermentithermobacillaceae bacterium]
MSKDLLLEIGADEIPARYLLPAIEELKTRVEAAFRGARLKFEDIRAFGTPRRLVLQVRGLSEKSEDAFTKVRGPSKKVAYDAQGNPTKALLGFSRSLGIDPSEVTVETENGGEYVYGIRHEPGQPVMELLPRILPSCVMGMSCPHPLRWGEENWRWYRPVRWVVCLYGEEVVPVEIAGKKAGRVTFGHRTLHPGEAEVPSPGQYVAFMEKLGVIVDQDKRRKMIWEGSLEKAREISGMPLEDEELLDEVTCLCEHPAPFLGRFDEKYLRLPREVLVTVMRHHQRYFPVVDGEGRVLPGFIGVRDGDPEHGIETVRMGNEWVIRARLQDAAFFYSQDLKAKLEDRLPELKGVYFLRGAGTVFDKSQRLENLAAFIGEKIGLSPEEMGFCKKAAMLSKCDLVTSMVREFPELEGIMGGHYAREEGLPEEIFRAISQQYLPRGAKDPVPDRGTSSCLALSDKIDTLSVAFSLGLEPTGSQDPLGLRRSAQGIVTILLAHGYDIDLDELVRYSLNLARSAVEKFSASSEERLAEFLAGRVEAALLDRGFPIEIVRAVLGGREKRPARLPEMAKALSSIVGTGILSDVVTGWRRTSVLARATTERDVQPVLLQEEPEIALFREVDAKKSLARSLFEKRRYAEYLSLLSSLRPFIDSCLDKVLIMAKDERLRENRLKLLGLVSDLFTAYADFSHVLPLVGPARNEK